MNQSAEHPLADMLSDFIQTAQTCGLHGELRRQTPNKWHEMLTRLEYVPVAYTETMLDYQLAYFSGHGGEWLDASLVLHNDGKPCAVWPLTLSVKDGAAAVSSVGGPVLPPLFAAGVSNKTVKAMVGSCHATLAAFFRRIGAPACRTLEIFTARTGLSEWHLQAMRAGRLVAVRHEMYLDLSGSLEQIRSSFRKSYKPLVTSGEKLWQVGVCTTADNVLWEEFRSLHLTVSGRVTRSRESWQAQLAAIAVGEAFLVTLRDPEGRMVGAGFFQLTRDEGLYAVGAYDRSLFDKPLGHVVQYHAILEMKRRGLRWYKLGDRPYRQDLPAASDKEISIAEFKQGFSSHQFVRLEVEQSDAGTEDAT